MKIIVTTHPFGDLPKKQLKNYDVVYNDMLRRYTSEEHKERLIKYNPDIIIAGTENYKDNVLDLAPNLKIICRVGIGLDNVDLVECKERNIKVTYTPDAPSNAVAELVICQMINMLRKMQIVSQDMKDMKWNRFIGLDIRDCNIGVIGCGRIGTLVIQKLQGLKPRRIFGNDIIPERSHNLPRTEHLDKMQLLSESDIITMHIPHNEDNHNYINEREFQLLKDNVKLINMSRGGIVNEDLLYEWLTEHPNASCATDTYIEEPYKGNLLSLDNFYPTPHLASCTEKSRFDMEMGAVEDALNYMQNRKLNNQVA